MILPLAAFLLVPAYLGHAQDASREVNFDNDKIKPYVLPELLQSDNGKKVKNVRQWEKGRRAEILSVFTHKMYGTLPPADDVAMDYELLEESADALGGKATRRQVDLTFKRGGVERSTRVLIYIPNDAEGKVPCFLGLNFRGNQAVGFDPDVMPSQFPNGETGSRADKWDIEQIIDAGYALVTAHYYDFFPDKEDGDFAGKYPASIYALWGKTSPEDFQGDEGAAISAWAWGYSRILDYLETGNDRIDPERVAVMGHSRLGKTALWVGANDPRFALVISNDSGCCGAALSRRRIGEDFSRIMRFKHWFCKDFYAYRDNEEGFPADQHGLLALIAPRPLYVASGEDDRWADPEGEYLSCLYASEAYGLYGIKALEGTEFPEANKPLADGQLGYHVRTGPHTVTPYDWKCFIEFANRHFMNIKP